MRFFQKAVLSSIQGVWAKEMPTFCSFLRPPTRTSSDPPPHPANSSNPSWEGSMAVPGLIGACTNGRKRDKANGWATRPMAARGQRRRPHWARRMWALPGHRGLGRKQWPRCPSPATTDRTTPAGLERHPWQCSAVPERGQTTHGTSRK